MPCTKYLNFNIIETNCIVDKVSTNLLTMMVLCYNKFSWFDVANTLICRWFYLTLILFWFSIAVLYFRVRLDFVFILLIFAISQCFWLSMISNVTSLHGLVVWKFLLLLILGPFLCSFVPFFIFFLLS